MAAESSFFGQYALIIVIAAVALMSVLLSRATSSPEGFYQ